MRLGTSYIGSPSLKTTIQPNEEIVPPKKEGWTVGYNCYKFSFLNDQAATVIINNNTEFPILLRSGQGFTSDEKDAPIYSFKIVESGVTYNFIGAVK